MDPIVMVRRHASRLGLSDWRIGFSSLGPDESDERSAVDIDRNLHAAVIRLDPGCPPDQVERQILHEPLHVRLAELEDAFLQVVGDNETARTWWHRSEERAIEAFVAALAPDQPRRDYRGAPPWPTASY